MSELMPPLIELRLNTGLGAFDAVTVAAQSDDLGEAAALALLADILCRVANGTPQTWALFRSACDDAARELREHADGIAAEVDA